MDFNNTEIEGLYIIENKIFKDERGGFLKLYNKEIFEKLNLELDIEEIYYSTSNKDVIRGMHFQKPPYHHHKLITLIKGEVVDVIVDLRKDSKTYGKYVAINLVEGDGKIVFIPKGCAHGFKAVKDDSIILYNVTTGYNGASDGGVRWDSFGYDWGIDNPIISDRDKSFDALNDFNSPF